MHGGRLPATALLAVLVAATIACEGVPSSPSSRVPDVAGTYTGSLSFRSSLGATANGSMRMVVRQSGRQLTITGSVTFLGETLELPASTGTINATGFYTPQSGGIVSTVDDPTCGTIRTTSASLTFSGRTARYTETATTQFCGNWTLSATLQR